MAKLKRPLKYPADRPIYQDLGLIPLNDPYFTDDSTSDAYYANDAQSKSNLYETLDS